MKQPYQQKKQTMIVDYEGYDTLFQPLKHYDKNLESAVLGACLLCGHSAIVRVRRFLAPEMFYYSFHQTCYRTLIQLFDEGLPVDLCTAANALAKSTDPFLAQLVRTGFNIAYETAGLTNYVVSDAHMEYHAFLIREQFIERQLLLLTTGGLGEKQASEKIREVQQKIDDLMQLRVSDKDWMHVSDVLIQLYRWMVEIEGKTIVGVPSGFPTFDRTTGGIPAGLYYLGARPSVGKSALAMRWILNQASEGYPVGVISLEMPNTQLGARILSLASGVDYWRIFRNKMSPEVQQQVYGYAGTLAELPIYISDSPAVNMADIRAKTYKLLHKHGCKAIYIDYIQLVTPEEGAGTREQEVARLSRGLKLLSMQTNIPIIALAQLSRESERSADKKPRLIHLRESGSIEQDADGVIFIHRDFKSGILQNENGQSTEHEADLIVAKWRNGETFEYKVAFDGPRMEFREFGEVEAPF